MLEFNCDIFFSALQQLRNSEGKLIHCITNFVTANDCANAVLAVGAVPCMANSREESAQITAKSDALVLNMGTLSPQTLDAMIDSAQVANSLNIPVVLDPVGIGGSDFRKQSFLKLAENAKFSIVKGNLSEISQIVYNGETPLQNNWDFIDVTAKSCAKKLGCICAVSGETDFISDSEKTICLKNGSPYLSKVSGTGCICTALTAAFCSVVSCQTAVLSALSLMNLAGETAAENFKGMGSFKVQLFDAFSQISKDVIERRLEYLYYDN